MINTKLKSILTDKQYAHIFTKISEYFTRNKNNEVCSDKLCMQCTNKVGKREHEVDRFE